MQPQWYELRTTVAATESDEAAARLVDAGFAGLEERPEADGRMTLVVFAECADEAALESARQRVAAAIPGRERPAVAALDPAVWTENWRRHFVPIEIGERLVVLPPWKADEAGRRIAVVINPGIAFGTGHHETTSGCLRLLDRYLAPGMSVADVGCGSGILAIAAVKLGAASATATDNDPDALQATEENARDGGVLDRMRILATLPATEAGPGATFDIVLANILAETLVELRELLQGAVAPGGMLILSGIEKSRRPLVDGAFLIPGWSAAEAIEDGDWVTLALHRDAVS
jgi:ribosomal protein L11 methyltransferase